MPHTNPESLLWYCRCRGPMLAHNYSVRAHTHVFIEKGGQLPKSGKYGGKRGGWRKSTPADIGRAPIQLEKILCQNRGNYYFVNSASLAVGLTFKKLIWFRINIWFHADSCRNQKTCEMFQDIFKIFWHVPAGGMYIQGEWTLLIHVTSNKEHEIFPHIYQPTILPCVCMYDHHSKVGLKELFVLIKMYIFD